MFAVSVAIEDRTWRNARMWNAGHVYVVDVLVEGQANVDNYADAFDIVCPIDG